MGIFDLFRPKADVLKENIIYSQKGRITKLEQELDEIKQNLRLKESELKEAHTNFDRGKDRLVDQIIELSDKFAEINDMVAKVHHENGKLRTIVESKRQLLVHKAEQKGKKK